MADCVFCQIVAGKIASDIVYQDKEVMAFRDINPQAATHVVIIPKKHIPTLADISEADLPLVAQMVSVANEVAKKEGISKTGYRVVINCGEYGGQIVPHLHMHLLGGKRLSGRLG